MDQYDKNLEAFGFKPEITSVDDALNLHKQMVRLEFKLVIGDPYAMPHYRGEQRFGWDISSGLFRIQKMVKDPIGARLLEKKAMVEFESVIKANFGGQALRTLFDSENHGKDWDLLFQAQHAGVKTSLLDWSPEMLTGLYFCTEESNDPAIENSDGQLWVYVVPFDQIKAHNEFPVKDTFYDQDPQTLGTGLLINNSIYLDSIDKRPFETRMFHQKGRFFISSADQCHVPLNKQADIIRTLFRFTVPAKFKSIIRTDLTERRITREYFYGKENEDAKKLIHAINAKIYN